ncbi:MAG: N-acetylmuramoyl-L-alanine amidase [Gemmatimonadota bacterium]
MLALGVVTAAAGQSPRRPVKLPPIPARQGPLGIVVGYPGRGSAIAVGDSTFLFGTVGDGRASLTINGQKVPVAPNGAWLAWVAVPPDSAFSLQLEARRGSDSAHAELPLSRAGWVRRTGAWVDRGSLSPIGEVVLPTAEALPLTVRAAAGARVTLRFPDGRRLGFVADSIATPSRGDRYVATLDSGAGDTGLTGSLLARLSTARATPPMLEIVVGADTTLLAWPVTIVRTARSPQGVRLNDDLPHSGTTDRTVIGRGVIGGSYSFFFPNGTVARADARFGNDVRLRLDHGAIAWVPLEDVHSVAAVDDPRLAVMGSLVLTRDSLTGITRLRVPLSRPVPLRVDDATDGAHITLFGAVGDVDWTRYGTGTEFVRALTWRQEDADRIGLDISFNRLLWGWRVRVAGTDLLFEFREPPAIDPAHPLRGRHIAVDPGHPPIGACGPTGLCEPEANLAIARQLRDRLVAQGARVTMTRQGMESVGLWQRVALADSVNAEVLISIHNNALPDGVNPATNNGTSTFYNHLVALPLARAVQAGLLATLGLRDLGIARGDLALVRPTWYPAVLAEGLFLMVPEQEAALRTVAGQRRYADGVLSGLVTFLRQVSAMSTATRLGRPRR